MNSLQINCFLEAAKYHSFSKAAEKLYISQPTFSRNIAMLEQELGIRLFHRNSFHGIDLTEAGHIMEEVFSSTRSQILTAMEKAQQVEQNTQLPMTIGLLEGQLLDHILEDILSRFRIEHPNVLVNIKRSDYQGLMNELQRNETDIVYMPEWQFEDTSSLTVRFIGTMETVMVIPRRLIPEIEQRVHSIKEFSRYPFINIRESESQHSRNMLLDLFQSLDINPPVYEAHSIGEQIEMVEMGEGILLINPNNFICYSPNVHCVHAEELLPQPFAIAWKTSADSQGLQMFQRFLSDD